MLSYDSLIIPWLYCILKYAQGVENSSCDRQQYFDVKLQMCVCVFKEKKQSRGRYIKVKNFKSEEAENDCHSPDRSNMKYGSDVQLCRMYLVLYYSITSIYGFAIQRFESIPEIGILSSLKIRTAHLVRTYIVSKAKYLAILPTSNDLLTLNRVAFIIPPFDPEFRAANTNVVNHITFQLYPIPSFMSSSYLSMSSMYPPF